MFRPGDFVQHKPSGKQWVVCGVSYDKGQLIPCENPFPTYAQIDDCVLIESRNAPQTKVMANALAVRGLHDFIESKEVIGGE